MKILQPQYPIGLFEPLPLSTVQLDAWLLDVKYFHVRFEYLRRLGIH
ncbi:MAG: hypothetical protein ACK4HE_00615 [Chitinophagaceae bacterium]